MRRNSHLTAIAGFALAAILLAAGGLLLWGSTYTHNMIHNQLAAQQIFFPPAGSDALKSLPIDRIRSGRYQRVLTGGYDAISELVFVGFDSLQAATPEKRLTSRSVLW